MRALRLRKETLAELTVGELVSVNGASGTSCTYECGTALECASRLRCVTTLQLACIAVGPLPGSAATC
ncbi:MAG TPA: hypothetical protein VFQ85_13655 [Mycobacteriales bacterium]|jgi:hypothetical protein|nr:hypothetical protein [Mycobacteriales bacterium]